MPKTATFTTITPLPAGITRKSVLDMYHDHLAMIDLNPLVVERFKCKPPNYASTDEYWSMWYTIKDKVSYLPGGLAQGSVSYHACFHDLADGLQTHVYAPLGLDIQAKWSVGGRLPGEPKPAEESGVNTPRHGLYVREDVQMKCSSLLMSFVKRTFKDSHGHLVEKLVERAHILESNFANQRLQALRNVDPGERTGHGDIFIAPPPDYLPLIQAPLIPLPRLVSHNRSHSDPILSPSFSSSSTLVDTSERPISPSKDDSRPVSFRFILEEHPISASAPLPTSVLLPATTFDGGFSQRHDRPLSLYPGSPSHQYGEQVVSALPSSPPPSSALPRLPSKKNALKVNPPRVSYTPEERPMAFTFPFDPKSPSNKGSSSELAQPGQRNVLNEIDDAIDEVFLYTLPATTFATLPKTVYAPAPILVNARYDPTRHMRKDSVMPHQGYSDGEIQLYSDVELPPVPLKDEKYRKLVKCSTR